MKTRFAVLAAVLVCSGRAIAHEGHDHAPPAKVTEIGDDAAKARAAEEVKRLVSVKKVEAAWSDATLTSLEKKTTGDRWEWLAKFEAPKAKGKTLFVFLRPGGEFVAANFTGK